MSQNIKSQHILVTGASGAVGKAVCQELLARGNQVIGYDIRPCSFLDNHYRGDITNVQQLTTAMQGMDCVIHLAATPDEADFEQLLLPNNILGTHNVFQVAYKMRIKRLIFASSIQVSLGNQNEQLITIEAPPQPVTHYALSKLFGESYCKFYAQRGITVISARLGWLPRDCTQAQIINESEIGAKIYLSPGDAGTFFAQATEYPLEQKFVNVFVSSRTKGKPIFDLTPAKKLLAWEPVNIWPEGLDDEHAQCINCSD